MGHLPVQDNYKNSLRVESKHDNGLIKRLKDVFNTKGTQKSSLVSGLKFHNSTQKALLINYHNLNVYDGCVWLKIIYIFLKNDNNTKQLTVSTIFTSCYDKLVL